MCLQVFLSVVIDPLLDWVEVEWSELSDKEKEEMEREADERAPLLFLPCPFTTEAIAQPPYKGTDPEWKEFLSVNKDAELQDRMKGKWKPCVSPVAHLALIGSLYSTTCRADPPQY